MQFTYEDGTGVYPHILKMVTPRGLAIEIYFSGLDAAVITLGGSDYEVSEDGYQGLGVDMGRGLEINWLPVASVIQQANAQIEDIVREVNTEHAVSARHEQSFSQPSL